MTFMNPEKHINDNEQIEKAEYDRDIKIAEQKRFEQSLGFQQRTLNRREAVLEDLIISPNPLN